MEFTIGKLIFLIIGLVVLVVSIIKYLKPLFDLYFKRKDNYFRVQELKLGVYEKRENFYDELYKFIKHIVTDARLDIEKLYKFDQLFLKAKFLFDEETYAYIKKIRNESLKLQPSYVNAHLNSEENKKLLLWYGNELSALPEKFMKYLDVSKISD